MTRRVVIIGGGIAGLGAALGLARRGSHVTIVERDPAPEVAGGDEAFDGWERRMVAHFRQPHGFSSRSRNLLRRWAPDVLDRLRADGIEELNVVEMLRGPDERAPDDELLTGVLSRRPAFELALRRAVDNQDGVTVMSPVRATGLTFAAGASPPRVTGVTLDDGSEVSGDVVLDCGGRRSPVSKWLAAAGVELPVDMQPTNLVYFSRYYRQTPEFNLFLPQILARADLGYMLYAGFPGDHQTYALVLGAAPWDDELRVLRHNWAWEAAVRSCAALAPWIDPAQATPIQDVHLMHDKENVRHHLVVDGAPLVAGLLPVGDALCATNPAYGWGASLALTYAFAAVDALTAHPDDPVAAAVDYDAAVRGEVDSCYSESAAMDRIRGYKWRGLDIPDDDLEEAERQELVELGVIAGAGKDPALLRAFLRRMNLIEAPDALFADDDVMARARAVRDRIRSRPPRRFGPTRDELLEIVDAHRPVEAPVGS